MGGSPFLLIHLLGGTGPLPVSWFSACAGPGGQARWSRWRWLLRSW